MIHIDNLQKILSGRTICKIVVQNNNLLNKLFWTTVCNICSIWKNDPQRNVGLNSQHKASKKFWNMSTFAHSFFSCPGQLNRWPCHSLIKWVRFWFQRLQRAEQSRAEQSRAEQSRAEQSRQWFRFRFRLVDTSRHWLQWLQRQRFRFRLVDTSRH